MELLVLAILFSIFSGCIAGSRNRNPLAWALVGLCLGPFGLLVGLMPVKGPHGSRH